MVTYLISTVVGFVVLLVFLNFTVGTYSRRIIAERDAEIAAEEIARKAEDAAKYSTSTLESIPPASSPSIHVPSASVPPPANKYYLKLQCHIQDGIQYCSFPSDSLPVNGKMSQND